MKNGMKQTEIGEIPAEWEVVKLGEVASINQASLPNSTSEDYSFWYVDLSAVKQGAITFPQEQIRFGDSSPRARRKIKPGDVIVATVRPNLLGYAIVKFDTTDIICSTGFAIISPSQQVIGEFIYQWLYTDFLQNQISKLTVGSNYPAINSSDVAGFLMPLPPLPEQRKIAEILSTLDEKMAVIDEQLAQTQELKKGLMQRLLTRGIGHTQFKDSPLGEIPASWEAKNLNEVSNVVRGASPRPAGSPLYFGGDFLPWITVASVTNNVGVYLKKEDVRAFLTETGAEYTRILQPKTVILSNSGATLGVPKILTFVAGANDGVAAFLNLTGVSKRFLYYFLDSKTDFFRNELAPGSGQPNLNTSLIGNLKMPLPPLPEQRQIAEILTTVDDKIGVLQDKKAQYHTLKKGLMQQLLTGQRRVLRVAQAVEAAA